MGTTGREPTSSERTPDATSLVTGDTAQMGESCVTTNLLGVAVLCPIATLVLISLVFLSVGRQIAREPSDASLCHPGSEQVSTAVIPCRAVLTPGMQASSIMAVR
jgi:hypothetical protein